MSKSEKFSFFIYSIFLALLFILINGYQFNISDQEEHLPQVYSLLSTELYPNDFFVNYWRHHFTVRDFYVYFIYSFSVLLPVSVVCFVFTIACLAASAFAIIKITRLYSDNFIASYLAPVLVLIFFYKYTLGGNVIQYNILICSSLSKAFALYSIYFFLKKRFGLSGLLLGICCLFQVLVGLQLFIIFLLLYFVRERRVEMNSLFKFCGLFILFSVPVFFPIFYAQSQNHAADELFYNLLFYLRSPSHYMPSLFPITEWIRFSFICITGIILSWQLKKKQILFLIIIVVTGLIFYSFLLEILGIRWIGKIQWFKSTIWVNLFSSILIAIVIAEKINVKAKNNYIKNIGFISASAAIMCLIVILFSSYFRISDEKYKVGIYKKNDLTIMHEWIEANTDKEDLFITFPYDKSFLSESKRSLYITFFPVVHEAQFFLEWSKRLKEVYQISLLDGTKDKALQKAEWNYNSVLPLPAEKSLLRIVDLKKCTYIDSLDLIHKQANIALAIIK